MTLKSKTIAAAIGALVALPLAFAAPADASPTHGDRGHVMQHDRSMQHDRNMHHDRNLERTAFHGDRMHDRGHRPAMKVEYRPHHPHGHYRWHAGNWKWQHGHWSWAPGIWIRL